MLAIACSNLGACHACSDTVLLFCVLTAEPSSWSLARLVSEGHHVLQAPAPSSSNSVQAFRSGVAAYPLSINVPTSSAYRVALPHVQAPEQPPSPNKVAAVKALLAMCPPEWAPRLPTGEVDWHKTTSVLQGMIRADAGNVMAVAAALGVPSTAAAATLGGGYSSTTVQVAILKSPSCICSCGCSSGH